MRRIQEQYYFITIFLLFCIYIPLDRPSRLCPINMPLRSYTFVSISGVVSITLSIPLTMSERLNPFTFEAPEEDNSSLEIAR